MNHYLTTVIGVLLLIRCTTPGKENTEIDYGKIKQEILTIHQNSIQAHLNKDPEFFIKNLADDYVTVSNGEIKNPTKEEIFSRFSYYLSNTEFLEYKDTHDPIIGFSKDGSVAWLIAQVQLTGLQKGENNKTDTIKYKYAWLSLFEKQGDVWTGKTNVSNGVAVE